MKATALVVRGGDGHHTLTKDTIDVPSPAPNQALVKVLYAAQNPTDVQSFDTGVASDGAVLGCDFTGTVEAIGSNVTKLKKGDTVAGLVWGGESKGVGAFGEYTLADEKISFRVPDGVALPEATTVPLAACTAWLALFSKECLAINRHPDSETTVLVWSGSSSVGRFAIQLAALCGLRVITTCSPKHADALKSFGAQHVFDYHDPEVVAKIKKVAPDLKYVFDTIGTKDSSTSASEAIAEPGGTLCTVRPGRANTENVTSRTKVTDVLVWTAFLKEHRYGEFYWPPDKADHELCAQFFEELPEWLLGGRVKPSVPSEKQGLDSIREGFQEHRNGKVSGYKIIYKL
ncbi:hypothetical protein SCAR479_03781 [Seiridium cardinale]|uniref:Enoyl reductase (ER) domain-containing protein n=1 Tax=Seiridium cardinale TaxID=138064 RepID=A0ABR2XZS2_9PEZI